MVQAEQAALFSKSRRLTTHVYFVGCSMFLAALLQIYPGVSMHSEEFFFNRFCFVLRAVEYDTILWSLGCSCNNSLSWRWEKILRCDGLRRD